MVNLTIDGIAVQASENATILEAAAQVDVRIPTLCYLKELNEIGACRVCVVEVEGNKRLVAACNNRVEEGMKIKTNSPRVHDARRTNVELILSQHNGNCVTCVRSGNCELQTVSNNLNINQVSFPMNIPADRWNMDFPLIRENSRCIKCARCIQVCDKVQGLYVWDLVNTGSRTTVGVSGNRTIEESNCSLCGQCITHCPVGALKERDDTAKVYEALADPEIITVVQVAPAVRAAWAEGLGLDREDATINRLAAALRKIGFNYIFDTNFSADLTIMEEGTELLEHIANPDSFQFPMFTSCCPGWVRFLKSEYPDMLPQLSTAKSPQQMFGAVAKTYFAEKIGVDPKKIFSISIMPCTAKKHESALPEMMDAGAGKDVDVVLTTREAVRLIRANSIDVTKLEEEPLDSPLGSGTGAAVIFGTTGGVMEAALRSAYALTVGKNPPVDAFQEVRGLEGRRVSTFDLNGTPLTVAVTSGLQSTRDLIEDLRAGRVKYDFVEIMACPGGCGGGGGQPIWEGEELAGVRGENLRFIDQNAPIRFSHENPDVAALYENYMEKPGSHRAHKLLHTEHKV